MKSAPGIFLYNDSILKQFHAFLTIRFFCVSDSIELIVLRICEILFFKISLLLISDGCPPPH